MYFYNGKNITEKDLVDPECSPQLLTYIISKGKKDVLAKLAASHPRCPRHILHNILKKRENNWVSWAAASNPNAPLDDLFEILSSNKNDTLSVYAGRNSKIVSHPKNQRSVYAETMKNKEYGWMYINVPEKISKKTLKMGFDIPDREIYRGELSDNNRAYGVEDDPHITVVYGIHTTNHDEVKEICEGLKGGTVTLDVVDMFENENYDVLKINIKSTSLHSIFKKIMNSGIKITTDYTEYKPHITIAYLKCGNGEKYIGNESLKGVTFDFDELYFGDKTNKESKIRLS